MLIRLDDRDEHEVLLSETSNSTTLLPDKVFVGVSLNNATAVNEVTPSELFIKDDFISSTNTSHIGSRSKTVGGESGNSEPNPTSTVPLVTEYEQEGLNNITMKSDGIAIHSISPKGGGEEDHGDSFEENLLNTNYPNSSANTMYISKQHAFPLYHGPFLLLICYKNLM